MSGDLQQNPCFYHIDCRLLPAINQLLSAVQVNYAKLAKILLQGGVPVNGYDNSRTTSLHFAIEVVAKGGNTELVDLLLNHGADVDFINYHGESPLFYAISIGDTRLVKKLLTFGKGINVVSTLPSDAYEGYTPLHYAIDRHRHTIVDWLLENGADVNIVARNGETPLHIAIKRSNFRIAEKLVYLGADVNAAYTADGCDGCTPLLLTLIKTDSFTVCTSFLKSLLEHGADPNLTLLDKVTPLHWAVRKCSDEAVELLLEHGANPHALNVDMKTAFFAALETCRIEVIKPFLQYPGFNNEYNANALRVVLASKTLSDVLLPKLLKYGFSFANYKDDGASFYRAVTNHCEIAVEHMLKHGFEANDVYTVRVSHCKGYEDYQISKEFVPLHHAVSNCFLDAVRLLIEFGADVNARNEAGKTAISLIDFQCKQDEWKFHVSSCIKITALLLENGARAKDNPELLCFAVQYGYPDFTELLLKYNADVNGIDKMGRTALHFATQVHYVTHREKVLKMLLDKGADVNVKTRSGAGALHFAALHDEEEDYVAKLLLKYNADVNIQSEGVTPLHLCCFNRKRERSRMLLHEKACVLWKLSVADLSIFPSEPFPEAFQFDSPGMFTPRDKSPREVPKQGCSIAGILVEAGADVNAKDDSGHTPLHCAAQSEGMEDVMNYLISRGAVIIARDHLYRTALHYAWSNDTIKVLVEAGANINCQDLDGCAPLHLIARAGGVSSILKHVQFGSDINLVNNALITPLEEALVTERCSLYSAAQNMYISTSDEEILTRRKVIRTELDLIKEHIFKLKVAGLYVHPKNEEALRGFWDNCLYAKCKDEISAMKMTKVGVSDISYYDIFTSSKNQLAGLSKVQEVVEALRVKFIRKTFPNYAYLLEIKVKYLKLAPKRPHLLEMCIDGFRECFGIYGSLVPRVFWPDSCSELILDYLSDDDLESFVRAYNLDLRSSSKFSSNSYEKVTF